MLATATVMISSAYEAIGHERVDASIKFQPNAMSTILMELPARSTRNAGSFFSSKLLANAIPSEAPKYGSIGKKSNAAYRIRSSHCG